MPEQYKPRKIDRRTVYTKNVIKDALLDALNKQPFEKIGITEVCQIAELNRGTFYLHYHNLVDVLNEILDDALSGSSSVFEHLSVNCGTCEKQNENSICRAVQKSGKYWPVFHDSSASSLVVNRIVKQYKEDFIEELVVHSQLTKRQAEAIFYFQINGCLAASRVMDCRKTGDWPEIQKALDCFIKGGLERTINKNK